MQHSNNFLLSIGSMFSLLNKESRNVRWKEGESSIQCNKWAAQVPTTIWGLAQVLLLLPNVWKISSHFQATKTQHKKIAFKSLLDTSGVTYYDNENTSSRSNALRVQLYTGQLKEFWASKQFYSFNKQTGNWTNLISTSFFLNLLFLKCPFST